MLPGNRAEPLSFGGKNGLNLHESQSERRSSHKQGAFTAGALAWNFGGTAGPRAGHERRVVDRDRDVIGLSAGDACLRGEIEQGSGSIFTSLHGCSNIRIAGEPLGDGIERGNHRVESRLHVAFGPGGGCVGGRPETPALENTPTHEDERGHAGPGGQNPPPADPARRHVDPNARERRRVDAIS